MRPDDRPCHQLREKADEQRVVDRAAHGLLLAAIHVHHVGHALEGVKADAQRKNDVQPERVAGLRQQQRHVARQEIIVFEKAEKSEVRRETQNQQRLLPGAWRNLLQPDAGRVVDGRQRQQQRDELVIPAGVEEVAGRQQDISPKTPRAAIEERQHHRQEDEELNGVEEHGYRAARPSIRPISSASIGENRAMPARFKCIPSRNNSGCSSESNACSSHSRTLGREAQSRGWCCSSSAPGRRGGELGRAAAARK